jgi:hypothetical protein
MYSTSKEVKLLDRRLGLLHLSIWSLILAYVVGARLIAEHGFLAVEESTGTVSARLQGVSYKLAPGGTQPADGATLVRPQGEADAIFLPTRVTTTAGQRLDNCTDPAQSCTVDIDCPRRPPLAYGLCEQGFCVSLGWCPHEQHDNPAISETTTLQELDHLFVVLAADIAFPRLKGGRGFSTEDGRPARTRWSVAEIVRRSGATLTSAVEAGLLLSVVVKWNCDLNPSSRECLPGLLVYRIGGDTGFTTQWADYYQQRDNHGQETAPVRDQHVARGVRLLFSSRGVGKRVDLYACVLQLFMALALLPIASTVTDTIMQNLFAERRHYREYKMETTPDFSDVRAKVEALEKQTKSQQQKMLQYDE